MAKKSKLERSNAAHERAIKILNAKIKYHDSVIDAQNKSGKVLSTDARNRSYVRRMTQAGVTLRKKAGSGK